MINMEPKHHPIGKIIFQTIIFRLHVNLPGCNPFLGGGFKPSLFPWLLGYQQPTEDESGKVQAAWVDGGELTLKLGDFDEDIFFRWVGEKPPTRYINTAFLRTPHG